MQYFIFFQLDNHIDKVGSVTPVKKFQREMVNQKIFPKKDTTFVWAHGVRYHDIRHILQNPELCRNITGFNDQNCSL